MGCLRIVARRVAAATIAAMKKLAPWVIALVAGAGLGFLAWYVFRTPEVLPGNAPEVINEKYERDEFLADFDWLDNDGRVTFDEFAALYGEGEGKKIFSDGPGKPGLDVKTAFSRWDVDKNGVVDELDFRKHQNASIEGFQKAALAKGLSPEVYYDKLLALNMHQQRVFDDVMAAESTGQAFWRGRFIARKYFESWGTITTAKGTSHTGLVAREKDRFALVESVNQAQQFPFDPEAEKQKPAQARLHVTVLARPANGTEHEGLRYRDWGRVSRGGAYPLDLEGWLLVQGGVLYVLQPTIKVRSFKQADCTFTPEAEPAALKYYAQAKATRFDDIEGNLALARQCAKWDMPLEAVHHYARALVFKRDIEEALKVCGLKLNGDFFVPQD